MNLVLLCVSSIFLGRYLEKRMKVASIAHSVLFIVIAFFFLFHSGFELIDHAIINVIGEEYFYEFQEAIMYAETIYGIAFSSLFVIEFISYLGFCVVAILALIKGFKALIEKTKIRHVVLTEKILLQSESATTTKEVNNQNTYLVLGHLRN